MFFCKKEKARKSSKSNNHGSNFSWNFHCVCVYTHCLCFHAPHLHFDRGWVMPNQQGGNVFCKVPSSRGKNPVYCSRCGRTPPKHRCSPIGTTICVLTTGDIVFSRTIAHAGLLIRSVLSYHQLPGELIKFTAAGTIVSAKC